MPTVPSTDHVDVAVHDLGGTGGPALLAHATGFHGRIWEPLAGHLHGLHSWAPDLRGHGDSPVPDGHDMVWDRFADDVLAVVDGLGLDRPVGVGHSKGGAALVLAEQRRPGTFSVLWLYEPVIFPPGMAAPAGDGVSPLALSAANRRAVFASEDAALANFAGKPPMDAFAPEVLEAYVRHGFRPDPGGIRLKCHPAVESAVYGMGGRHRAFDDLGEVTIPVTVARGRPGTGAPVDVAAQIAEALPAGRLETHHDLGHFGPMEAPAAMAASIELARIGSVC